MTCFEHVSMVTDEATRRFGSAYFEDTERKKELQSSCEHIDSLLQRFDAVSYDIDVDEYTMDITISIMCNVFQLDNFLDEFYIVMMSARRVIFKKGDDNLLQVGFVFDGIWV